MSDVYQNLNERNRIRRRPYRVVFPKCRHCGFEKHTGIHMPLFGQPIGSKPWGHEFEAEVPAQKPASN